MAQVSFALREDPNSIFLLQDAGRRYKDYCQITVFGRQIIRPEFFRQYLCFASFTGANGKYRNGVTKVRMSIEDNDYRPQYNYVAVIDSEVEFRVTPTVIQKLSKEHMPAWGVKSYLDYFSDKKSGILLFLRVYKIAETIPPSYLEKGIRGSTQILKLYDEYDEEVTVYIDGIEPVISDNKFMYLKDEILHFLKVENSFICIYESTDKGLSSLQERVDADRQVRDTHYQWENAHHNWFDNDFSEDDGFDMAQLDYEAIYQEVLSICPGMKNIIDYVRSIQAARLGEYDYYLEEVHNHTDREDDAVKRLFEMSVRSAVKNALNHYKKYGTDIMDAFQEACIGIVLAINKHNENVESLFPSYVSMWVRQVLNRNISIYERNVRVPIHYRERIDQILSTLTKEIDESELKDIEFHDLYRLLLNNTDCDEKESFRISYILTRAESVEEIVEDDEKDSMLNEYENQTDDIIDSMPNRQLQNALDSLKDREKSILEARFGIGYQREKSLEEIGEIYGITRERVRQIESKAKYKILTYYYNNNLISVERYNALLEKNNIKKRMGKRGRKRKQN